jgi:phosphoadenosine phosphosulfate reductase
MGHMHDAADARLEALYLKAEHARLTDADAYNVAAGLQRFRAALAGRTSQASASQRRDATPRSADPGPAKNSGTRGRSGSLHGWAQVARKVGEDLAGAPAEYVIAWALETFGSRLCITSSMTDAVLIHLASRQAPGIDVLFLDTGYHFPETIGTRDAVSAVYPVNVINVSPPSTVAEQDAELGPRLYSRNPDLCCYLRKVVPLEQALAPYDAWLTGIRREESDSRSEISVVQWDPRREMVKVNPIVEWTQQDVDDYIAEHGILVNPLVYDGYPSIGCRTCTARAETGADPRSGRWAGTSKRESGIHS